MQGCTRREKLSQWPCKIPAKPGEHGLEQWHREGLSPVGTDTFIRARTRNGSSGAVSAPPIFRFSIFLLFWNQYIIGIPTEHLKNRKYERAKKAWFTSWHISPQPFRPRDLTACCRLPAHSFGWGFTSLPYN